MDHTYSSLTLWITHSSLTLWITHSSLDWKFSRAFLDAFERDILSCLISKLDSLPLDSEITVNSIYYKYRNITLNNIRYTSAGKKSIPVVALAKWDENLYGSQPATPAMSNLPITNTKLQPVNIHYYMKVIYCIKYLDSNLTKNHIFAFSSWLSPHPACYDIGKPAEIWCDTAYEPSGSHSFIPIDRIVCRCAHGVRMHNNEKVKVIIPLPSKTKLLLLLILIIYI